MNTTSWPACEELTRVRPKFVFTRVFVFCPCEQNWVEPGLSPVYTAQTNPGRTRVRSGLKLTQVVFTRHFSKLTRVEPGLVVFTQQTNPGRTRVSIVYKTETNPGRTRFSLCRVNRALFEGQRPLNYHQNILPLQEFNAHVDITVQTVSIRKIAHFRITLQFLRTIN